MVEWLCLCYIGEQSFGRYSSSRKVFYSNIGASLSQEILLDSKHKVNPIIAGIISASKEIKSECKWQYCQRRAQDLIDAVAQV